MQTPKTKGWYAKVYLRSHHWRVVSNEAKRRAGWKCERCHVRKIAIVHHLHYQNLGHEEPGDLWCLCDVCHNAMHRYPIAANDNQMQLPFCPEEQQRKTS